MRRWENPSDVLAGIHQAVDDINTSRLPHGVRIVPIHDRTELVASTLRTISRTLTEALVIVVLILSLTLGSVRAALLTALTIPLSLLFAFVCMHLAGIPANLLSLGAIDFGIIVDGNLVMVQHILRRLAERERRARADGRRRYDSTRGARDAAAHLLLARDHHRRVLAPVYIGARGAPAVYADGVHGLFRAPRCIDPRLTLVPVLATWVFRHGARTWRNPLLEWMFDRYELAVRWTLAHARLVVGTGSAWSWPA